jgi:two-component SAPR family response regulator
VVIFVTAFDNFAVAAFDVAAIDYLMKPVDPARLERALVRVRDHLAGGAGAASEARHDPCRGILGARP